MEVFQCNIYFNLLQGFSGIKGDRGDRGEKGDRVLYDIYLR